MKHALTCSSRLAFDSDFDHRTGDLKKSWKPFDCDCGASSAPSTIGGTNNPAVLNAAKTRNNGRYNGNGRHWRTPAEIFAPLHREFFFNLDPCGTHAHPLAPELLTISENEQDGSDGLLFDWAGFRVFMNPPYGREIYAWTRKARESRAEVVVGLLPASTDLAWWHDDVLAAGAKVRYIRGRVRFLTDGPYRASGFFPSVIVIWTPREGQA